jgi:RNA polymerase sigma-70 factor (ECF subfamily)
LKIIHSNFTGYESLERRIENNDSINLINKLINLLPEKQRLVIQLRDIECYEFKEISEIIGMNETAIRVTLSRARKKLRNELIKLHNYGTQ